MMYIFSVVNVRECGEDSCGRILESKACCEVSGPGPGFESGEDEEEVGEDGEDDDEK